MLDTNIYDKLRSDPEFLKTLIALQENGQLEIVKTHIQEDELAAAPFNLEMPSEKIATDAFILGTSRLGQARLGDGTGCLKETKVPTAGAIWGTSRWGDACWGDGSQSGMSVDDIKTEAGNHIGDSLIAVTASNQADIFVTEDTRLRRKMKNCPAKCKVMDYSEFKITFHHP